MFLFCFAPYPPVLLLYSINNKFGHSLPVMIGHFDELFLGVVVHSESDVRTYPYTILGNRVILDHSANNRIVTGKL